MRPALPLLVASLAACALSACKDGGKSGKDGSKVKPSLPPATLDAGLAARPADAAVAPTDAGDGALTPPPPGGRGVQIIDVQYGGFRQPGLPAIKDDGSELVATAVADDGGRGYLHLDVVVLDGATGAVRATIGLADPDESNEAINRDDAAGNFEAEEAQLARVRARLDELHARLATGTWRTLATSERADTGPPQPSESIAVGDLTFTYELGQRRLTVARGGATVATHELGKVLARPRARSEHCPGDLPYLGALHVDAPTRKVLVELAAWPQGHNCEGDGPTFTVVPLP